MKKTKHYLYGEKNICIKKADSSQTDKKVAFKKNNHWAVQMGNWQKIGADFGDLFKIVFTRNKFGDFGDLFKIIFTRNNVRAWIFVNITSLC